MFINFFDKYQTTIAYLVIGVLIFVFLIRKNKLNEKQTGFPAWVWFPWVLGGWPMMPVFLWITKQARQTK